MTAFHDEKIIEITKDALEQKNRKPNLSGCHVGVVTAVEQDGTILIDYEDNPYPPLSARTILEITPREINRHVLLNFERNDPELPIIIGLLKDTPPEKPVSMTLNRKKVKDVVVDGETLVFNAKREILLKCGKSSLLLKKDGKIVIQGENVTSQAKRINQLLGSRIAIN